MTLRDFGEKELIRRFIRPHLAASAADLDDCAFVPLGNGLHLAITIDAGPRTPFLRVLKIGTPFDLGHYFATMTLSDLAAVGAAPSALVAAYLLPEDLDVQFVAAVAAGVAAACAQDGAEYVGGDTKNAAELRVVTSGIGVTTRPLRRTGVSNGDLLFISGPLGVSLQSYLETRLNPQLPVHRPRARVSYGRWLAESGIASACLDMSDGPLSAVADLARVNAAEIAFDVEALLIKPRPSGVALSDDEWLALTLGTGADFELMFTAPARYRNEIIAKGGIECGRIHAVGTSAVVLYDRPELLSRSWEHFVTVSSFEDLLRSV
jgi:thiamine-monophosphate kinase